MEKIDLIRRSHRNVHDGRSVTMQGGKADFLGER